MSELPPDRLQESVPFTLCGVVDHLPLKIIDKK